jgi:transforming growth factor-beta-induced protein
MKRSFKFLGFLFLGLVLAACQRSEPMPSAMDVMKDDSRLDTFMTAMNQNGNMMQDGKTYTIFAPTTDAFVKFFSESGLTAEEFLSGDGLAKVLSYHVAEGSLKAADIIAAGKVKTVEGSDITVTTEGSNVLLNGSAKVLEADKMASNAVIHIIDTVLMPPTEPAPLKNIVEIAAGDERFSTLVAAVTKAGLVETLSSPGPFTVFAPTNDAFAALLDELGITAEELLASPDLASILTYHVVAAKVTAADVVKLDKATTVNGKDITIEVRDGNVILNGSIKVIITDIMASNGVIHVIDGVLLPPDKPSEPTEPGTPTPPAPEPEPAPQPQPAPEPQPAPQPEPAPQPSPTAPVTPELQTMLGAVNKVRAQGANCGGMSFGAAGPLTLNAQLNSAAQKHSEDMAAGQEMSHTTPSGAVHYAPGTTFSERAEQAGYAYQRVAENVAFGYPTVEAVMDGWMNSPGHCRNIMNPELTELGLGESENYWTQVFGTPQ